jgi:lipopolysaccharide heptosyltransferase I
MESFLIIRLSSLGDIIHTLPAFSALRKTYPGAKISWAVEKKGKDILDLVPGIDEVIEVGSPGWRRRLKNRHQVALDFQGLVKSGMIAWLSRAGKRIGFSGRNLKEPLARLFYTDRLEEVSETGHVIDKNLELLTLVGIRESGYDFPLEIPGGLNNQVLSKMESIGLGKNKKLCVFNVGAAWETKLWPSENWINVLEGLKSHDVFPVILWGNPAEKELALHISQESGAPVAPFFSVKEVLAFIRMAHLVVSGDTFALQAACALSIPVVGLFGPTNPRRNGPFALRDKAAYHPMECSLCYKRSCPSMECMKKITPEEVIRLVLQSLEEYD